MIEDVKSLVDYGFAVHLLKPRSKAPVNDGWSEAPVYTYDQLKRLYRPGQNVGVRLGKPSRVGGRYLHVIDLDIRLPEAKDEAYDALKDLFPGVKWFTLPCVRSGSGGESRHFYFLTDEAFRSRKLAHSDNRLRGKDGRDHWEWEIELFGSGKQVAIPPSVHPETGKRYEWIREPDLDLGIPTIDADLIYDLIHADNSTTPTYDNSEPLGLTIEQAEDILNDLQDWADDRETWVRVGMALKHEFADDKKLLQRAWQLFDAWSKKGRGYNKRENLAQWRSFKVNRDELVTMRSLVAEVNDRRIYAAVDELDELDEFEDEPEPLDRGSLIAMFESEGSETPKRVPRGIEPDVFEQLMRDGVPANVLAIPGVLQEVVDYYNATAMKPQPQFAVQAALAFGSVVLGRNWSTDQNNFTSLYFLNLAPTSGGKEHIKRVIETFLGEAGLDSLIGPKTYSSEAGVLSTLLLKPRHISITDEFGRYLASSRGAGNANKLDMQSALMEVFGRLDGIYYGIGYSTRGMTKEQIDAQSNMRVDRPALTLVGMTTPTTLYDALGQQDVVDGFLNRFLIVESPLGRQEERFRTSVRIPSRVLKWARDNAWQCGEDDDDLEALRAMVEPSHAPEPRIVPFAEDCVPILKDMSARVHEEMNRLDEHGMAELYGRTREIAMRVALIVAVSDGSTRVERRHLEWARDYVFYYHGRMARIFTENLGKTDFQKAYDAVIDFLLTCGDEGAPEHIIARQRRRTFGTLLPRQRDELLQMLIRDNKIRVAETKSGRGPKRPWYIAVRKRK